MGVDSSSGSSSSGSRSNLPIGTMITKLSIKDKDLCLDLSFLVQQMIVNDEDATCSDHDDPRQLGMTNGSSSSSIDHGIAGDDNDAASITADEWSL